MRVFRLSKGFPAEERFALTSQIGRIPMLLADRARSPGAARSMGREEPAIIHHHAPFVAAAPGDRARSGFICRQQHRDAPSQIRRASRSVCLNLREAWAKRRYEAHFLSKLTDCDGENAETDSCLDFALDCGYLTPAEHKELTALSTEVGKLLGSMLLHPEKWILCHN